jgi:xanthine/CO dehydrogenase XdhC/CoxF family maturation factor
VRDLAQTVLQLIESGQRAALATVVRTSGSTPQRIPKARRHRLGGTEGLQRT